ncbi:MAG: 3-deoxy-7-phosphoheptulonate synthase [Planctomycetota bacterium]|nr:3-deoxy-7-phosphoheptulonate synthase [Planctomycetota bacterium]
MIIILKSATTESEITAVTDHIASLDMQAHVSRGTYRTIIGVIGDEASIDSDQIKSFPGVSDVVRVLPPYKLASLEAHPQASVIRVGSTQIGGGHLAMVAGPCSIESEEGLDRIAKTVKASGANILRGGAFKPRTSPYSFQGMGVEGLKILRAVGDKYEIPVVTEITDTRNLEVTCDYADMLQVGARNMQNFVLLTEVGKTNKPVILKRGMSATIQDLLMSAEYILAHGNSNVVLCERGIKGFDSFTRNLYDVASVAALKTLTHLPVIVDPSHATGRPDLIPACAYAGLAAGADGVHIEVHDCPEKALSDGPQALLPDQFEETFQQLTKVADVFGKTFS